MVKKRRNMKNSNKQATNSTEDVTLDARESTPDNQTHVPKTVREKGSCSCSRIQAVLEERINQLLKENDESGKKEAALIENVMQLEKEKDTLVQKEATLERRVQQLEDEKDSWTQIEGRRANVQTDVSSSAVHVESSTKKRAERLRANLSEDFKSKTILLHESHLSGKFYLRVPETFMKMLPHDKVDLIDENGIVYEAEHLINSHKLKWKKFAIAHNLVVGDALVLQLIESGRLKVYIVRAREDKGALDNFSESIEKFKNVKNFEDFKINMADVIMESDIPTNIWEKYYELCCSQNDFLHYHLVESLANKFVTSMISEIVSIVDAIRTSNINTSLHLLTCWETTLKSFQVLGMSVGFLRSRLHELMKINCEAQSIIESEREKNVQLHEEFGTLAASIKNTNKLMNSLAVEIEDIKMKKEKLGVEFIKLASGT